jgi:hypothetical protein
MQEVLSAKQECINVWLALLAGAETVDVVPGNATEPALNTTDIAVLNATDIAALNATETVFNATDGAFAVLDAATLNATDITGNTTAGTTAAGADTADAEEPPEAEDAFNAASCTATVVEVGNDKGGCPTFITVSFPSRVRPGMSRVLASCGEGLPVHTSQAGPRLHQCTHPHHRMVAACMPLSKAHCPYQAAGCQSLRCNLYQHHTKCASLTATLAHAGVPPTVPQAGEDQPRLRQLPDVRPGPA